MTSVAITVQHWRLEEPRPGWKVSSDRRGRLKSLLRLVLVSDRDALNLTRGVRRWPVRTTTI